MGANQQSLADNFIRYFSAEIATTAEQDLQAYQLRYQVYCQEFQYESADAFPDGAETDDFDAHAINCLIRHRGTDLAAGCIRVVTSDAERGLPLERYCLDSILPRYRELLSTDREDICEFSRLAVNSNFRRRPREAMSRVGRDPEENLSRDEERTFPLIAVASFLSSFVVAEMLGRDSVFAMMEPFLPRMLKRSGILPDAAGEQIDYHGLRAAYFITTRGAIDSLNPELRMLYEAIKSEMVSQDLSDFNRVKGR